MALNGAHIACGYTHGIIGVAPLASVAWAQTLPAAGATGQAAPANSAISLPLGGSIVQAFEVRTSVDAYVAVGPSPDAAIGPRVLVPANTTRTLACAPGDRLAWAAA